MLKRYGTYAVQIGRERERKREGQKYMHSCNPKIPVLHILLIALFHCYCRCDCLYLHCGVHCMSGVGGTMDRQGKTNKHHVGTMVMGVG